MTGGIAPEAQRPPPKPPRSSEQAGGEPDNAPFPIRCVAPDFESGERVFKPARNAFSCNDRALALGH